LRPGIAPYRVKPPENPIPFFMGIIKVQRFYLQTSTHQIFALMVRQAHHERKYLIFTLSLSKAAWQRRYPVRASTSSARMGLHIMQLVKLKNAVTWCWQAD
jgi:hypothetical protein